MASSEQLREAPPPIDKYTLSSFDESLVGLAASLLWRPTAGGQWPFAYHVDAPYQQHGVTCLNSTFEHSDLMEEQRRIEEEATLAGIRRAERAERVARDKGREAFSPVGNAMVQRIIEPMICLLTTALEKQGYGRATNGGPLLRELKELDLHLVCLAATRAALGRMSEPQKLTAVARAIGEAIEDEVRWHRWDQLNAPQAKAVRQRVNQSGNLKQRRAALAGFARGWEKSVVCKAWSSYHLIKLGIFFVDYLVRLGVFEKTRISINIPKKKRKAAHAVQLSPEAAEWAKEMGEFLALSRPLRWPLVVPPKPWTAPSGGGFHFCEDLDHDLVPRPLRPLYLVRRPFAAEQRAMLEAADLSVVYGGLNAAQATAWRVNPATYAVLVKLLEEGAEVPGLVSLDSKEIPERLSDEEAKDEAKRRARNKEARLAHKTNAQMFSKRLKQHCIFSTAKRFVNYKEIYFAYNLDFRGRVYACSDDLSPHGDDLQRGLLEFAHGDPLDAEGVKWLAIHLANCWGFDKVSFEERERWTYDKEDMILRVANDPLEHRDWFDADKKTAWQFLAACFAWKAYREGGLGTVCRVPVMLDGSCSGIQHYAALLRDEEAGRAVNLLPSDKPNDLYADVALHVMGMLKDSHAPFAKEWHAWGIDRKIVKRSVMTLPYGAQFSSCRDYTREAARERMEREGRPRWLTEENEREALGALAKIVWKVMREVVTGPVLGMKFVRQCVGAWRATSDHKFHWVSPCGFPAVQRHLQKKRPLQVNGEVDGLALAVKYSENGKSPNWLRAGTTAPPNFVHSLDASHLLISLKRASEEGITPLVAVHDAFGTTPTKTARFAQILREEFATMYQSDPLECLREPLRQIGGELPEEPTKGCLRVSEIACAEYLFA